MDSHKLISSRLHLTPLVLIAVAAYAICLVASGVPVNASLFRYAFAPVPIVLVSLLVFNHLAWKWSWLNSWFSRRPVLCGTWQGQISPRTHLEGSSDQTPIPCYVVIRQTYTMLSVRLMTEESQSHSVAERILEQKDGLFQLVYMYQNEPKAQLRGVRSEIHNGAMQLAVETHPLKRLTGHYWTDRNTSGEVVLEHFSDRLIQSFAAAKDLAAAAQPSDSLS